MLLGEEAEFETWLSGSPAEAFALALSFDPAMVRFDWCRSLIHLLLQLRSTFLR